VLGRQINFEDGPRDIVGVLTSSADAAFDEVGWRTQVLVPLIEGLDYTSTYGSGPVASLRPGVQISDVAASVTGILKPVAPEASADPAWRVAVTSWRAATIRVTAVRDWMLMILGAVGLVVLIACVNAATVMLTRSSSRAHELAIRASLGASRRSLAALLLTESLILSISATIGALLISAWALDG
jgi:predicted lysophospholipase L1 biosynthesis ABC-type transport system permease subunit